MADEPEISENGVFYDSKNNEIVDSPPEEGVQIVAPGARLTDAAKAEVEHYRGIAAGASNVGTIGTQGVVEAAVEDDVETAAEKPAKRAAKKA